MELRGRDVYRVIIPESFGMDEVMSLVCLYQPLASHQALSLYLTLYAEGTYRKAEETHSYLSSLLHMDCAEIEKSRIQLEKYRLLRTYAGESHERTKYIYQIIRPHTAMQFLQDHDLNAALVSVLGKENAAKTAAVLTKLQPGLEGYREITVPADLGSGNDGYLRETEYSRIGPKYNFGNEENDHIRFDYELFFASTTPLVFPIELRTEENLHLIGILATVHGLSPDKMRVLTAKCINMKDMTFQRDKLRVLAEKEKPDVTEAQDPYSLPPVSFLQSKQGGARVSLADRKILEYLTEEMNFSVEVTNIMIEYILGISQNRLVAKFVEMVAGEWARDGVRTKEDALAACAKRKNYGTKTYSRQRIPSYMQENTADNAVTDADSGNQRNDDISELKEMLKKIGDL